MPSVVYPSQNIFFISHSMFFSAIKRKNPDLPAVKGGVDWSSQGIPPPVTGNLLLYPGSRGLHMHGQSGDREAAAHSP